MGVGSVETSRIRGRPIRFTDAYLSAWLADFPSYNSSSKAIARWLAGQPLKRGLVTVFVQHTSASLTIQENADPDVIHDLDAFFTRLVPEDNRLYRHTVEGPDDMPAHIRAALTTAQLSIPVEGGRLTRISHQNWFRK